MKCTDLVSGQAYLPLFFVLGACWVPQMSDDLGKSQASQSIPGAEAPSYNGYGSPSTGLSHWRSQVRNSPGTGRSQRSDETLASRVSKLEDSFARIETWQSWSSNDCYTTWRSSQGNSTESH
eukprot:s1252_g13.t1